MAYRKVWSKGYFENLVGQDNLLRNGGVWNVDPNNPTQDVKLTLEQTFNNGGTLIERNLAMRYLQALQQAIGSEERDRISADQDLQVQINETNERYNTLNEDVGTLQSQVFDLEINVGLKQDKLIAGSNITITPNGDGTDTISSTGGSASSEDLVLRAKRVMNSGGETTLLNNTESLLTYNLGAQYLMSKADTNLSNVNTGTFGGKMLDSMDNTAIPSANNITAERVVANGHLYLNTGSNVPLKNANADISSFWRFTSSVPAIINLPTETFHATNKDYVDTAIDNIQLINYDYMEVVVPMTNQRSGGGINGFLTTRDGSIIRDKFVLPDNRNIWGEAGTFLKISVSQYVALALDYTFASSPFGSPRQHDTRTQDFAPITFNKLLVPEYNNSTTNYKYQGSGFQFVSNSITTTTSDRLVLMTGGTNAPSQLFVYGNYTSFNLETQTLLESYYTLPYGSYASGAISNPNVVFTMFYKKVLTQQDKELKDVKLENKKEGGIYEKVN